MLLELETLWTHMHARLQHLFLLTMTFLAFATPVHFWIIPAWMLWLFTFCSFSIHVQFFKPLCSSLTTLYFGCGSGTWGWTFTKGTEDGSVMFAIRIALQSEPSSTNYVSEWIFKVQISEIHVLVINTLRETMFEHAVFALSSVLFQETQYDNCKGNFRGKQASYLRAPAGSLV